MDKHRAMVALEMEVLAKKFDRFGWERDRNSPAHDRMLLDWMNALQDYPLSEIQAACREAVLLNPDKMPNEGRVSQIINADRGKRANAFRASRPKPQLVQGKPECPERRAQIVADVEASVRRMP